MRGRSISVAFPTRNQAELAISTVRSFLDRSSGTVPLEFVIVDDDSTPECRSELASGLAAVRREVGKSGPNIVLHLSDGRLGVARARNMTAALASRDILFITDGHVSACDRWDEMAADVPSSTVVAGTIRDDNSSFHGYGCVLAVPFMGTHWVRKRTETGTPVQVAASPATVLWRRTFLDIGGFDSAMNLYGAIEPEFSVRAWLAGFEIHSYPDLEIFHQFKDKDARVGFLGEVRPSMIHNAVRFGILYLPELMIIEMLRYYALLFPEQVQEGFNSVDSGAAFRRREWLAANLPRDFSWYCSFFSLKDQGGEAVLPSGDSVIA
jgi:GT2 family glycosyltransferase